MSQSVFVSCITYNCYRVIAWRERGTVPDPTGAVLVGDFPDLETAKDAARAEGTATVFFYGMARAKFFDGKEVHLGRPQFVTTIAGFEPKPPSRNYSKR